MKYSISVQLLFQIQMRTRASKDISCNKPTINYRDVPADYLHKMITDQEYVNTFNMFRECSKMNNVYGKKKTSTAASASMLDNG